MAHARAQHDPAGTSTATTHLHGDAPGELLQPEVLHRDVHALSTEPACSERHTDTKVHSNNMKYANHCIVRNNPCFSDPKEYERQRAVALAALRHSAAANSLVEVPFLVQEVQRLPCLVDLTRHILTRHTQYRRPHRGTRLPLPAPARSRRPGRTPFESMFRRLASNNVTQFDRRSAANTIMERSQPASNPNKRSTTRRCAPTTAAAATAGPAATTLARPPVVDVLPPPTSDPAK